MIMNKGQQQGQNLQYIANAAFLANLFADYLNSTGVPGFNCGPNYIPSTFIRNFATSQVPTLYLITLSFFPPFYIFPHSHYLIIISSLSF